ncbi:c-type cytochrome [Teredinibacter waterburyi]|jgi:Cytochrome c553|uniref:c-type cytochrome n=1 Tax=Teredinibacter waterburyi TaxID=1500538 RepID=UPI00165FFFC5|nr:c-type cytochrome [Teredinibacter waterburyi]
MKFSAIVALCLTLPMSTLVFAGDAPSKEMGCRACHGASGAKPMMGSYPKLNGQNKDYLISALKAYRDNKRSGGMAIVMVGQAKSLSDADITALAEYYASQP